MRYTGDYTYQQKRDFVVCEIQTDGFLSWETLRGRINGLKKRDLNRMIKEGVLCLLSNKTYDTPERRDKRLYSTRHKLLMWCENCNTFSFKTPYGTCQICKIASIHPYSIFPMAAHGEYR